MSISALIHVSAFESIQPKPINEDAKPNKKQDKDATNGKDKEKEKKKGFYTDLQETDQEKKFRERKVSLARLFEAVGQRPIGGNKSLAAASMSNPDPIAGQKKSKKDKEDKKGKGKAKAVVDVDESEDEGVKMDDKQVLAVYEKAMKNDMNLPEMDPPSSFKLTLRPYQKQALQ